MKPNILFIMTDQMRGDCMSYVGHPDVKTPHIDNIAASGYCFERAYTACPSCIAARATLMTGLSPRHAKRVGYADGVNWDYDHTLAGELKKSGYYTKCVGKMHVHPLRNYLDFDDILLHDGFLHYYRKSDRPYYENQLVADDYIHWLKTELGANADVVDTGIDCNSFVARPWIYEEKYHPTNWVTSNCIDFLRKRDRSKPYFLYASYVRPHPPFDAPQCFFDMYSHKELTPPLVGDWADNETYKNCYTHDSPDAFRDDEMLRQAQVGYYACITHLDYEIGRLMQAMFDDGDLGNTIILFSSDHGELLGDHHTFRKSRAYEGSSRIPFIITLPASMRRECGVRLNQVVSLEDIMPTLIEYAGGKIPESLDGKSLVRVLDSNAIARECVHEYIHGEHSGGAIGNQFIVTSTDKYVWFMQSGLEQYFDLENDPHELHDLINSPAKQDRIKYLRQKLINELDGREEGYTDGEKLISGLPDLAVLKNG